MTKNKDDESESVLPIHAAGWGEDIFALVASRQGSALAKDLEEKVEVHYRLELRERFQHDQIVNQALVESKADLPGAFAYFREMLAGVVRPGTEAIFDSILKELLEELAELHKKEPSRWLVSQTTGKLVMPVTADTVFTPEDYEGEDGLMHKARPILHPKYSVPLTELAYNDGRKEIAIAKSPNPFAIEHLKNPDTIVNNAKTILDHHGVQIGPCEHGIGVLIEVGREHLDGIYQSPNYAFHRANAFGSHLAKKVLDLFKKEKIVRGRADLSPIELKLGRKERWYEIKVQYEDLDSSVGIPTSDSHSAHSAEPSPGPTGIQ